MALHIENFNNGILVMLPKLMKLSNVMFNSFMLWSPGKPTLAVVHSVTEFKWLVLSVVCVYLNSLRVHGYLIKIKSVHLASYCNSKNFILCNGSIMETEPSPWSKLQWTDIKYYTTQNVQFKFQEDAPLLKSRLI